MFGGYSQSCSATVSLQLDSFGNEVVLVPTSCLQLNQPSPSTVLVVGPRTERLEKSKFFNALHEGAEVLIQSHSSLPGPAKAIVTVSPVYPR